MNKKLLPVVLCGLIAAPLSAWAEDSEKESPPEEWELAERSDPMTEPVKKFLKVLEDLDRRYPDSAKIDVARFMETEGEAVAQAYCNVLGFDGPCVPEDRKGDEVFVAYSPEHSAAKRALGWWDWLTMRFTNVGIIPHNNACPAGYAWTEIRMDDEDRRNANRREGWIGATVSNANTSWRFCKVSTFKSMQYRPLPQAGNRYDYAVLNMGLFCPSGARRYTRMQTNEVWGNQNGSYGGVFPNFRVLNTWFTLYCHFDGGASSALGHMTTFPQHGFAHGVFAPLSMPTHPLGAGYVHQDDEDLVNWNSWLLGSPDEIMGGGRNTLRYLMRVE
ncbi:MULTISPECIES: hypothetical protein [Lysobacter]|uniref:Uncharacterized protein n=1 Tax=Lysobacter yananisis TaxID=1003114 RepID=A0ABY9PE62_9GAMM|nr:MULTISPECIES: hypothetical protein [Lysobacter]QQQ02220.1 hypothetical protein JHW41_04310 [Lysobacter enzymogenes]UZW61489.1 hypothetical protein BV903_004080 [Lysobacter enzymogenes]WMT05361.1 hypothetical protein RDV84_11100 [Lysobacter yananisis]